MIIFIIIINNLLLIIIFKIQIKPKTDKISKNIQNIEKIKPDKKNLNIYDEFFFIPEV